MKNIYLILILMIICALHPSTGWCDQHQAEKVDAHEHEHEHGHEEEKSSSVSPDKGVVEASEKGGIKLSPEAFRNFEIKTQKISTSGPWMLPSSARVHTGEEINLYRFRNGFFKRIEFTQVKRSQQEFLARSQELKIGDEVVINGAGFLRIAEITAFGGAPEGHIH